MKSRLWLKAFAFVFVLVAGCTLAIALCTIPLTSDITYRMEERFAINLLDRVHELVEAKYQEIEAYRQATLAAKKRELKNITEVVGGYLQAEEQASRQGKLSASEARQRALENARHFIYGNNDYVWIADFSSVLISHPDDQLHRQDFAQRRDVHGNLIVPPMVRVARDHGEGYTSYWWNRLGRETPAEKLTYSRLFEPWNWVYGTGVYIDDIEDEVARRKQVLIGELREMLSKITLGETGYMYVFDARKKMIIHPSKELEGKSIAGLHDPSSGKLLADLLIVASKDPSQPLAYKWDRPHDPRNYVHDKLSWVSYSPGFDWYIASSVYQEELQAGSKRLTLRIAGIAGLVFVLSLGLGYLLLKRMVRPIEQLSRTALKVRQGDLSVRSGLESSQDEVGILAREFDGMVAAMAEQVDVLDAKVRESTAELRDHYQKLAQANQQIMDGIEYARTIQSALMPQPELMEAAMSEHFIIFRPKDLIGGDLYMLQQRPEGNILAVMDCTGHGVPGAIMTTIAAISLRRAINELGAGDPASLLGRLNILVRRAMGQENPESRADDGLEIGLCLLPGRDGGTLTFAGARLNLYVVSGGDVQEIKGDRQALGYRSSDPDYVYHNQQVHLSSGDMCYLATDGLADQAGGERGFPFGKGRFKKFVAHFWDQACTRQKRLLEDALAEYQRDTAQRDDITVLGFRLGPRNLEK